MAAPDEGTLQELRDLARRVALEKIAPRAGDIDRTGEYPQDIFDLLRDLGMFSLPLPEEHGGSGSALLACVALEEFGRICYSTANLLVVQWAPAGAILGGGTPAQRQKYLPGLASGSMRAAFSLTEAQSGSDVSGIRTRAKRVEGGFVLSGSKIWCTNASKADFVLVAARSENADRGGINFFIVDRESPGFVVGPPEDKMAARGVPSCPLFLENVFVPEADRLGDEINGFATVMEALNASRPFIAARAVGLAQGAMDHAAGFVLQRKAFGQNVADFQGIRWTLADMAIRVEAARQLTYQAARMVDGGVTGQRMAEAAAIAKCYATDAAMAVATDAVQLFGAAGISNEYPINRFFREAKVLQIVEGTNQIQRNIIGKLVLRRAADAGG